MAALYEPEYESLEVRLGSIRNDAGLPNSVSLMPQIVFNITPEQEQALNRLDSPHIRQGTGGVLFAVEVIDDSDVNAYTITPDGTLVSERLEGLGQGWSQF